MLSHRILLLFAFLSLTVETCRSHRWANSRRTMRIQPRYDYDDNDDYEEPYTMVMRRPLAWGRGVTTAVREKNCAGNSLMFRFNAVFAWADTYTQQQWLFGLQLYCEVGTTMQLSANEHRNKGFSPAYLTGRMKNIITWSVNDKIYKIAITGSFRTSIWESPMWGTGGLIIPKEFNCPYNQYMYALKGSFGVVPTDPSYLINLKGTCRELNPNLG